MLNQSLNHTFFSLTDDIDPFWLWGDWLLSDATLGDEGFEMTGSGDTNGNIP